MILKCSIADETKVFSYIGKDYAKCLYLYLDLKKYGIGSDEIEVFIQENDHKETTAVLLSYYSCIHVYSVDNSFNAMEIGWFVEKHKFSMVYCTTQTAELIFKALPQNTLQSATISTGWVAQIKAVDKQPKGLATMVQNDDFEQIVKLIYEDDDIGRSYKYDELAQQIIERNQSGYTRNMVIKDGNTVIAHACTNAELGDVAVVAELLVHKDYRRKGYASEIWRDLCNILLNENKEVYSFYYSDESRSLHKKIGFTEVCQWAKIVISNDTEDL